MTASGFGWQLTLTRDPERQWKRLVRRLRPATPSPVAFALVVAGLLTGTLALAAWAETPHMPAVEAVSRGEAEV
jgi:hypothetical protein